jgi:glycosyltransferase involved in cell wall biosynthesis
VTTVDLVSLGGEPRGPWSAGDVLTVAGAGPAPLAAAVERHLLDHQPDALLLWDRRLGPPPTAACDLLEQPDHVWHAGLALGTGGQPATIDLVAPTWMLNADPPVDRPATSWRLTLLACLVRREVIEDLGFVDPAFRTTTAAGLELGHRWITAGALCRHEPALLADVTARPALEPIGPADQQRFVLRRFGHFWATYTALRTRHRARGLAGLRRLAAERPEQARQLRPRTGSPVDLRVSVVIPTIDRYPWLRIVLRDLAEQTIPPHEVIVVDQTELARREDIAAATPSSLPLRVLTSEIAGQCTARNLALAEVTGDAILFLDDDDELPADLIASHLARLGRTRAEANCGVAREPGESELDAGFRRLRQSDVFPTNNTLLRREALERTGLFDLAYDRGERADHDLGTRLYLAGCRLVLDPDTEVVHHHAPRGGLRSHAARVSTYRASRNSTTARQRLAPTEVYLWRRYFRPDQVDEAVRLRLLGTFSRRGGPVARLARVVVQLVLLGGTRAQLAAAARQADDLCASHPTIPWLGDAPAP